MNELVPAFESSMFDSPLANIGMDFLELGIDSVLQDGLLKDIPIVGTIVSAGRFAQNVHDRNLLRQTLAFMQEYKQSGVASAKVEQHRLELREKPKMMEAELGRILILLNKNIDLIKSVYEARFYASFHAGQISWDDFCELCDITDRLFVSDVEKLREVHINGGVTEEMAVSYRHDRLISVGLLTNEARLSGSIAMFNLNSAETQYIMVLTDIGNKFCNIAFR